MSNLPEFISDSEFALSFVLESEDKSKELGKVSGPQEHDEKRNDEWGKITHYVAVVSDD